MDVAIMGCGFDALIACHAVAQAGHKPIMFGNENEVHGMAGYKNYTYRDDLPGITDQLVAAYVGVDTCGYSALDASAADKFKIKVYGDEWHTETYPIEVKDLQAKGYKAYQASEVRHKLYELYGSNFVDVPLLSAAWYVNAGIRHDYDLVINTLNLRRWCNGDRCRFAGVDYMAAFDAPFGPPDANSVVVNMDPDIPNYLSANLFGEWIVEWPRTRHPKWDFLIPGTRPIWTNCICHKRYGFHNIGHMALWDHSVMLHETYTETLSQLSQATLTPVQLDLFQSGQ